METPNERAKRHLNRYVNRPVYTDILGLSSVLRMPRIGKLHLGVKVPVTKDGKNEKCRKANHPSETMCDRCSYPRDLEHFVLGKVISEDIARKFKNMYGDEPKELHIYLPTEDRRAFFPQALAAYKGRRLWCKGDGHGPATRIDFETGRMFSTDCPCENLKTVETPRGICDERAKLMVILPRISMDGIWQLDTGSSNSIININSACEYYRVMMKRLAFVPFLLSRVPTDLQTPTGQIVNKAILYMRFAGDEKEVAAFREKDAISRIAAGEISPLALPPAPDDTEPEPTEDGITLNGEVLVPPDQAAREPEVVGGGEDDTPAGPEGGDPWPATAQEPASTEGDGDPAALEEPPPEKEKRVEGPPITKPKASLLRALFDSKGVKGDAGRVSRVC